MKVKSLGHVQLLATPWTAAYQAPPSMGFYRQEYWSNGHEFGSTPGVGDGQGGLASWDCKESDTTEQLN